MFNCKELSELQIRPPSLILLIAASQDRWMFRSQSQWTCVCHLHTHTHTYFVLSFPSTCGTASPSGPCPPSKSSSLPNLQIVSPDLLLSVSPSQAYLRFSLNKILYGAEVNLTPNLKTQGPGYPFQSGSSSGSQPNTQPQTSRIRLSLSVWVIIFVLSGKST